jgi:hypothetical protein
LCENDRDEIFGKIDFIIKKNKITISYDKNFKSDKYEKWIKGIKDMEKWMDVKIIKRKNQINISWKTIEANTMDTI